MITRKESLFFFSSKSCSFFSWLIWLESPCSELSTSSSRMFSSPTSKPDYSMSELSSLLEYRKHSNQLASWFKYLFCCRFIFLDWESTNRTCNRKWSSISPSSLRRGTEYRNSLAYLRISRRDSNWWILKIRWVNVCIVSQQGWTFFSPWSSDISLFGYWPE